MKKQELMSLIGNKLNAAKNEQSIAFDLFVRKVTARLSDADTLRIPEIGIFQLNKKVDTERGEYQLLYVPINYSRKEPQEVLVLPVKENFETSTRAVDSIFSFSYGKPLIPVSGTAKKDLFVQSSYIILQKSFEDKADLILDKSVYLKDFKILYAPSSQNEISIDALIKKDITEGPETEMEHIPWDFGIPITELPEVKEEVPQQESISTEEDFDIPSEVEASDKSFLEKQEEEIIEPPESEQTFTEDKFDYQNLLDSITEEKIEWDFSEKNSEVEVDKPDSFALHLESEMDRISDEQNEVEEEKNTFNSNNFIMEKYADENNTEEETLEESGDDVKETFSLIPPKLTDEEDSFKDSYSQAISKDNYSDDYTIPKKGLGVWFWTAIAAFILVSASGFYYFFYLKKTTDISTLTSPTKQKITTQIIERDYSIPVSIIPKDTAKQSQITPKTNTEDKTVMEEPKTVKVEEKETAKVENKETQSTNDLFRNDNKETLVKEFIFSNGTKYTVQLSSWRTRSVAEKEASDLKKAGYDAYISRYKSGSSLWYRVRVGEYSSLPDAENALNKLR